jgi:aldehyde dehydrogenase (NAD+)
MEVDSMVDEAKWFLHHLDRLVQDHDIPLPLIFRPGNARVIRQPFGSVLVIGPWNYPIILSLGPVIGAIAAGNCVVLKPSEVAPNVSRILAELIPKYLDNECIKVVEGGVEETTNLLKQKWDCIQHPHIDNF